MEPTTKIITRSAGWERENEVLAAMAGAESRRVDRLVDDVGEIKGQVEGLRNDTGRINKGVEELRESMAALNRHSILLEKQQDGHAMLRRDHEDLKIAHHALDNRVRTMEVHMPGLQEMRTDYRKLVGLIVFAVVTALLGLVIGLKT
jgi:chromosome segregation ATPase